MSKQLTLGSLFDGSGGFPMGALLTGIEPLWASEVEPFPIRVTTKRLPGLLHLGDINKINGSAVPPVDIITGGFCCQDLSVAGKRAGLHGERSGLFFQVVRIIKEMRGATNNTSPTFAVLENVPGMYSSNFGLDFLEVINELIHIKDKTLSVPLPQKGKWATAGEIVGDGFSLAWRTFDAQFWGVAQRRRRCYIVVDFAGERAGEILFDETRLRGNPPQSCFTRETTAGDITARLGGAVRVLNDQGGANMNVSENISGTLRAQERGHAPIVFQSAGFCTEHSAKARGVGYEDEKSPTLRAGVVPGTVITNEKHTQGGFPALCGNRPAVAVESHPQDSRVKLRDDGIVQTLPARMGGGGGNVPLVMNERQYALTVGEDIANTLTGTDYKGTQCVFEPKTLKIRSGREGGGKGALVQDNLSATLSTGNDQTVFVPTAYGISSYDSNAMKSANPTAGIYEADTSRTLDIGGGNPSCNQGGIAVVCMEGNASRPSHRGDGIREDVSFTLNTVERHNIAYAMTTGSFMQVCEDKSPTLQARDFKDAPAVARPQYTVRRLTPTECALLQGFPPDYCENLETPAPTEDDIAFWLDVWETHRLIVGKSKKPRSRKQIIKWLQNPHSDAAEYKMWGNGVALPCVVFVLGGIAYYMS